MCIILFTPLANESYFSLTLVLRIAFRFLLDMGCYRFTLLCSHSGTATIISLTSQNMQQCPSHHCFCRLSKHNNSNKGLKGMKCSECTGASSSLYLTLVWIGINLLSPIFKPKYSNNQYILSAFVADTCHDIYYPSRHTRKIDKQCHPVKNLRRETNIWWEKLNVATNVSVMSLIPY